MNPRILFLLLLGGCWPYLSGPYAPNDSGNPTDTATPPDGPTACADQGGVLLDLSVDASLVTDGTLTDGATWDTDGVQLTATAWNNTFYGAPDGSCLSLAPGELDLDLSQVGCTVTSVEIDVTDWCGSACTQADAYDASGPVETSDNGSAVGSPTTLRLDAGTALTSVSLHTYEATVCAVRLY